MSRSQTTGKTCNTDHDMSGNTRQTRYILTSQTSTQGAVFLVVASSSLSSSESFSSAHLIRCSMRRLNFFTAFGPPSTTTILTSLQRTAQPVGKTAVESNTKLAEQTSCSEGGLITLQRRGPREGRVASSFTVSYTFEILALPW